MPMKLAASIGANTFSAEGDFTFDEAFVAAFRAWLNAHQPEDTVAVQARIDALTQEAKASTDAQAAAIAANTPTP